jgi:hypothetical protein
VEGDVGEVRDRREALSSQKVGLVAVPQKEILLDAYATRIEIVESLHRHPLHRALTNREGGREGQEEKDQQRRTARHQPGALRDGGLISFSDPEGGFSEIRILVEERTFGNL